jgi:predicted small lipoprotein YifL
MKGITNFRQVLHTAVLNPDRLASLAIQTTYVSGMFDALRQWPQSTGWLLIISSKAVLASLNAFSPLVFIIILLSLWYCRQKPAYFPPRFQQSIIDRHHKVLPAPAKHKD